MRKFTHGVICAISAFCLMGGATAQTTLIKAAHTTSEDYPYHIGFREMAKSLSAKTGGKVNMQVFPNGSLGGNEREVVESLQIGAVTMTVVNGAVISNFTKKADVFNLPFIFRDINHLYAAMDGQPGQVIARELEKNNLKVVAWYANPERHIFTTKKPVLKLDDMKGMKIRVTQSPVSIATFESLGALPTPMAIGELYSGLQQGVVDGGENDWFGIRGFKFFEVAKNVSITGHFMVACPVLVNKGWYDKLPADVKKAFDESAAEGQKAMRAYLGSEVSKIRSELEGKGVKVNTVSDLPAWKAAAQKVYPKFYGADSIGKDLIDMVINTK